MWDSGDLKAGGTAAITEQSINVDGGAVVQH